ncbi:hypothetical protein ACIQGW_11415 [Lysinibacillus xylanilyticus]|uniref:RNA polymerase factor sigma-54 n=1 Tax=Lysinibacillus xylanilyticus TaxID=582475 RepID=UPI0038220A0B
MDMFLKQQQQQKMMMTPQLQQSIELLQYSTLELEQFLYDQQLENPLIELQPPSFQERIFGDSHSHVRSTENDLYTKIAEPNYREELLQLATLTFTGNDLQIVQFLIEQLDSKGYSPAHLSNVADKQH